MSATTVVLVILTWQDPEPAISHDQSPSDDS
jgi:hypothetical protein